MKPINFIVMIVLLASVVGCTSMSEKQSYARGEPEYKLESHSELLGLYYSKNVTNSGSQLRIYAERSSARICAGKEYRDKNGFYMNHDLFGRYYMCMKDQDTCAHYFELRDGKVKAYRNLGDCDKDQVILITPQDD